MGGEEIKTMNITIFQEVWLRSIIKRERAAGGRSGVQADFALFCFYEF